MFDEDFPTVSEMRDLWERRARCSIFDATAAPEGWTADGQMWSNGRTVVMVKWSETGTKWQAYARNGARLTSVGASHDYAYDAMVGAS